NHPNSKKRGEGGGGFGWRLSREGWCSGCGRWGRGDEVDVVEVVAVKIKVVASIEGDMVETRWWLSAVGDDSRGDGGDGGVMWCMAWWRCGGDDVEVEVMVLVTTVGGLARDDVGVRRLPKSRWKLGDGVGKFEREERKICV
ncbi:hypothetical protein Tco_1364795, partial [Tanacetum coccineum]